MFSLKNCNQANTICEGNRSIVGTFLSKVSRLVYGPYMANITAGRVQLLQRNRFFLAPEENLGQSSSWQKGRDFTRHIRTNDSICTFWNTVCQLEKSMKPYHSSIKVTSFILVLTSSVEGLSENRHEGGCKRSDVEKNCFKICQKHKQMHIYLSPLQIETK